MNVRIVGIFSATVALGFGIQCVGGASIPFTAAEIGDERPHHHFSERAAVANRNASLALNYSSNTTAGTGGHHSWKSSSDIPTAAAIARRPTWTLTSGESAGKGTLDPPAGLTPQVQGDVTAHAPTPLSVMMGLSVMSGMAIVRVVRRKTR